MDFLGELLMRLVPVGIPIILIWSFMINHGLAPDGSSKKDKEEKPKDKKSDGDGSADTKGPEK